MKSAYPVGPEHHQFLHGMQTTPVKQEPMDSSSPDSDLPVDMTLAQRDALYKSRDQHVSPSSFRPHDHMPGAPPSGFDQAQNRGRFHPGMFRTQMSTSLDQHSLPSPYGQHMYQHSHMAEESTPRRPGSNKRKQAAPLPHSIAAPSIHHSPPSQQSDTDDETSHLRADKDDMVNISLVMGNEWRPSSMNSDQRLQPRSSSGHQRARREFVPDDKKDTSYWCKRLKNNDSARRSRVKRKALEKLMESRLLELQKENIELRHEMAAMERRYNVKSNSSAGEGENTEPSDTAMPPSSDRENISQMTSNDLPSPPRQDKLSRDEELECASAGSDDSRSNDDSRMFSVGSVNSLHQSLALSRHERADSLLSTSSSPSSLRSVGSLSASTTSSRPTSCTSAEAPGIRLDKTGALDLTSDHSNRSTPARDSPDTFKSRPHSGLSNDSSSLEDAAAAMRSMKNF
ncbi:hypothetical protein EGW08_004412, partial [Elysia chlorotica]